MAAVGAVEGIISTTVETKPISIATIAAQAAKYRDWADDRRRTVRNKANMAEISVPSQMK